MLHVLLEQEYEKLAMLFRNLSTNYGRRKTKISQTRDTTAVFYPLIAFSKSNSVPTEKAEGA